MTNFDHFTQTLQQLVVDVHAGLSWPVRRMLALLTASLLDGTPAHLTALAEALRDVETDTNVKVQRVRRFLSTPKLSLQRVLPVFLSLLRPLLQALPELMLSMDRTTWKKRHRQANILMVSVYFEGRAIPSSGSSGIRAAVPPLPSGLPSSPRSSQRYKSRPGAPRSPFLWWLIENLRHPAWPSGSSRPITSRASCA